MLREACCEGRAISMGVVRLPMSSGPEGSSNSGKVESSKSDSSRVESTKELVFPANPVFLCGQAKRFSFSFSPFRGKAVPVPKPLGVPIGVVSAVDERSWSLTAGEKCKGGGVSRESSFTVPPGGLGRPAMFWKCLKCGRIGILVIRSDTEVRCDDRRGAVYTGQLMTERRGKREERRWTMDDSPPLPIFAAAPCTLRLVRSY